MVALTMLTYHDYFRSFSHHAICNYDVARNIELQGVKTVIFSATKTRFRKKYTMKIQYSYKSNL